MRSPIYELQLFNLQHILNVNQQELHLNKNTFGLHL